MNDEGGEEIALAGAQIVAKRLSDGSLRFVSTGADGQFALIALPPGEYDVWSCKEGFDEIRFRLLIDPGAPVGGFDFILGLSEHPGRRDLVEHVGAAGKS